MVQSYRSVIIGDFNAPVGNDKVRYNEMLGTVMRAIETMTEEICYACM
jgi:hypothetical protein